MKKWLIWAILLFLPSYAHAEIRVEAPASVKQGGVIRVTVETDVKNDTCFIGFDFTSYRAFLLNNEKTHLALVPVSVSIPAGPGDLKIRCDDNNMDIQIEIEKVDFPKSAKTFSVSKPTTAVLARFQKEREFLEYIYRSETRIQYFSETLQFANPLQTMEAVPNTEFGTIRKKVLINPKTRRIGARWKDYHKGSDFKASAGTPVFAAEDGVVVAARNLLGSGNTVIIDHGYGLISLYFHLSKWSVKEGALVKRGQKIGLAGMSGNAEGPHLHFEVRLRGVPVNPYEFLLALRSLGGAGGGVK